MPVNEHLKNKIKYVLIKILIVHKVYCPGRHPMVHTKPPKCNQSISSPDCKTVESIPSGADKCNICF